VIRLVTIAAGVLALWTAQADAATWCGTSAPADREPQVVAGHNVHAVYAIAADGADNTAAIAQALQNDAEAIDVWWRAQDATRSPRFDLFPFPCGPQLDLAVVRVGASSAQLRSLEGRFRTIEAAVRTAGLDTQFVKYLVYYDGPVDGDVCGQGSGSPEGSGIAVVYTTACAGVPSAATAAHELVHALGAMSGGMPPHECPDSPGHICDTRADLMYPDTIGEGLSDLQLDPGRDDYYGHAAAWFDVQDSRWLRRLDAQARLTLQLTGLGTIESNVPGLICTTTCATDWNSGTILGLTPSASPGNRFVRWGGACSGSIPCTLELSQAATVTAFFAPSTFRLTISRAGRGIVRSGGAEIACPSKCVSAATSHASLRLTAVAAKGWRFARWSGACTGTRATCALPMTKASAAKATFVRRR
jgi:hypothetical protein